MRLKIFYNLLKQVNGALSGNNRWEFFDSGFLSGLKNMETDLQLVDRCRETGTAYLRFYRWKPYTISLGYNQNKSTNSPFINYSKCREDKIDIVTRPTGGRAVLHSEELTYSVVINSTLPVHLLHHEISLAIINGLKTLHPALQSLSFTNNSPDLLKLAKTGMYNLCFNTAIKNEINYFGKKLVGSAQRKFGDIVLQHGSVLIGSHHKSIINYLNIPPEKLENTKNQIESKTTCLNEITGKKTEYSEVSNAVFEGFKSTFNIAFKHINRVPGFISERIEPDYSLN